MSEVRELRVVEDKGVVAHDKESMSVLVRVLSISRTPEERMWLAREIERTAIEDGYLRPEYRQHPRLVNPPRWRGGEM
jgi:hypothetical protein